MLEFCGWAKVVLVRDLLMVRVLEANSDMETVFVLRVAHGGNTEADMECLDGIPRHRLRQVEVCRLGIVFVYLYVTKEV